MRNLAIHLLAKLLGVSVRIDGGAYGAPPSISVSAMLRDGCSKR